MEELFRYPLTDIALINRRSNIIRYFSDTPVDFPLQNATFDAVQIYLSNTDERTKLVAGDQTIGKKLGNIIAMDTMTQQIHKGITGIAELLSSVRELIGRIQLDVCEGFSQDLAEIKTILSQSIFRDLLESKAKLTDTKMIWFDDLLRFRNRDSINKLLGYLYQLDVYIATGRVARERNFNFALASEKGHLKIDIEGVFHPHVPNAVANDIRISPDGNVIFLTGANMAGKSTFMKSLSISLYLAHMGFPVPAASMSFSVLDGIYTTINLPDDIGMGASHFYSEVLRVKKVATELQSKNLFVLFDELFRGTNVKDAEEATIAVAAAFAGKAQSIFVLSTHIMEAGEELKKRYANIRFMYLPTRMVGGKPVYTYHLEEGITEDRHGMVIINNEGILDILKKGTKRNNE